MSLLEPIYQFLACETPEAWVERALENRGVLLNDHAHCEKKAASTALSLIFRYPNETSLLHAMSRIAREELRHFEKVLLLMEKEGIVFSQLAPSRYAGELHRHLRNHEPEKLIDRLIIGAFIEARSCERFAKLTPLLDGEVAKFYSGLLAAEARHFQVYVDLAIKIADKDISQRIATFAEIEAQLIPAPDETFRFHSGIPADHVSDQQVVND